MTRGELLERVDLSARERHFLDHLLPVWRALPHEARGTVYVASEDLARQAARLVDDPVAVGWPPRGRRLGPILVASWSDLRVCSRTRRRVVFFEHGAGQTYSKRLASYAGGPGREKVSLFVVPSERVAARNRRYYPTTPTAIVGSPKVDELLALGHPPADPPTVAVAFHWRCELVPETGSGLDDFAGELAATRARLADLGVTMLGHAHPRIFDEARSVYLAAGIEPVAHFADVVRRAHVYAVDNSSTLFEFAALDRPVVVLNPHAYRRDVDHGLRFWTEADVGLHAAPGELADGLLAALEDRPDVASSRRAAVARAYAVTDGTSSTRAAEAIVNTLEHRRGCLVCGATSCACGPKTTVLGVDEHVYDRPRGSSPMTKKRYPNPARAGAYLKLSDRDAAALGLLGTGEDARRPGPAPTDVTNPGGGAPLVSSTPPEDAPAGKSTRKPSRSAQEAAEGAMAPSGPTHRARNAAENDDESSESDDESEAKTKKRPAPTSRRRRPATPKTT